MAELYGPRDLKNRVLGDGWDATELEKIRTEGNVSIEQITNMLVGAAAALNAELLNDPVMGQLFNITLEPAIEYRTGTTNTVQVHTEYGPKDESRGATQGHMLPRLSYDHVLGWTWDYLRRARMPQIVADIDGMVNAWRDNWEKALLTRFTKHTDDSGAAKGLGAAGYSPGFISTVGSTAVGWTPPPWKGQTFASTHEHYNFTNGVTAANYTTAIKAMTAHLFEHGHLPPYVLMISLTDKGTVAGLADFRPKGDPLIRYGLTQDIALVSEEFIGSVDTPSGQAMVYVQNRLPTLYMLAFKSYGVRSPRAPLLVRYADDMGLVVNFLRGEAYRQFPVEQLLTFAEYGVGVGPDRANGVCHKMAASYSAPTIT